MYPNCALVLLLCMLLSTATCSNNTTLSMFVKDNYLKCVAEGPLASSAILWTQNNDDLPNSEFLFKPRVDPLVCSSAYCLTWDGQNLGDWQLVPSTDYSLPPLDDFRWEMLRTVTSRDAETSSEKVLLPRPNWKISLSVLIENDAYIHLCDGDKPTMNNCYWLIVNGWPEQHWKSALRRCEGGIPNNYPMGDCATLQREHKGSIGEKKSWLTIQLTWNGSALEVLYQDKYSNLYPLFSTTYSDGDPFRITHLFVRSQAVGKWKLHQYNVLGLTRIQQNPRLVSKLFTPSAVHICISFFYIIYPGHNLKVSLYANIPDNRLVHSDTVTGGTTQDNLKWQEKRLTYNLLDIVLVNDRLPSIQIQFEGEGISQDSLNKLAMAIDSVRECDMNGDVRVSTVLNPGKIQPNSQPECYLSQQQSLRVTMKLDNGVTNARADDILAAGKLCSRVNISQPCEQMILCTANHCACTPGYYAQYCRPYCGRYQEHKNKFGPGCSNDCGKCSRTRYCNHITGECPSSQCEPGYKPPQCISRFLQLNYLPQVAAMSTSVSLTFNLQETSGEGYVTTLSVEYKELNDGILRTHNFSVPIEDSRSTQYQVILHDLLVVTPYEARGIPVDENGYAFFTKDVPPFLKFTTTCEADLELYVNSIASKNVTLTAKRRNMSASCPLNSYRVSQVRPPANRQDTVTGLPFTIIKLIPYTTYKFQLQQNGRPITTSNITFTTAEDAPGPVLNLRTLNTTDTVTVSWKQPWMHNGRIRSYIVTYQHLKYLACGDKYGSSAMRTILTNETKAEVRDLLPYSQYKVQVNAVTIKNGSTVEMKFTTKYSILPAVAPQLGDSMVATPTSLTISWSLPDCRLILGPFHPDGKVFITLHRKSDEVEDFFKSIKTNDQHFLMTGLEPFSMYTASVQFRRPDGSTNNKQRLYIPNLATKPDKPPAVTGLEAFETLNDSLSLRWAPLSRPRGELEHYVVQFLSRSEIVPAKNACKLWDHLICHTIHDLSYNQTYTIQVQGKNKDVREPGEKKETKAKTMEMAPTEPQMLNHTKVTSRNVTLMWAHPNKTNGKLGSFKLRAHRVTTKLRNFPPKETDDFIMNITDYAKEYKHTLDLLPSTTYNISVRGMTIMEGNAAHITVTTLLAKPILREEDFKVKQTGNTSAGITIPPSPPELINQSAYFLVVVPRNNESPHNPTTNYTVRALLILNDTGIDSDSQKSAWISAKFNTQWQDIQFELGNNSSSTSGLLGNNYTIFNLKPGTMYEVYLVAINGNDSDTKITFLMQSVSLVILPTATTPTPLGDDDNSNLFALLLLLLIPLLAFFIVYRYRWKLNMPSGEQMMLYPTSKKNPAIDMPCVTRPALPNPAPSPVVLGAHNQLALSSSQVKICDLQSYTSRCLLSGELRKQHEMFPKGQTRPWEYGRLPQNKTKNRYGNQLAYDDTRVKLQKLLGDPFSDYINANYIDGYKKPRMYIATQGPRMNTVQDFWRMVWQENIQVIAMLTNIIENGKAKCEQYWPESGLEATYGSLNVLTSKVEVFPDYTFRQFCIKLDSNEEKRMVKQLHFTTWPDHGVPLYPQSVASYLKKLLAMPLGQGPMLVHCSAGVGRTGTIVVTDACLRMAAAEGVVDVPHFLQVTRHCRANMVDNFEQYKLIHLVLIECLVAEPTSLLCDGSFGDKVKKLKESGAMSRFFAKLNETPPPCDDPLNDDDDEAQIQQVQLMENEQRKHKNRVQDIIPGSSGRIYLSRLDEDDPTSDYINAVSVDGYQIKDQFIATQFPLPGTIGDFWRLIVEKQVPVVVAMNDIDLTDETTCLFWPDLSQPLQPVPHLTVTLVEESQREHWMICNILVVDQSDMELEAREWQVTILHLKGWTAGNSLPPTETNNGSTLLELWEETERVYKSDKPIVVCCYDGATACGLFMALSFLIEKIKLEQECDVSQAVRTVKHNRKQLVSTEEQYEWLYMAANTYLEAFQTYANFQ